MFSLLASACRSSCQVQPIPSKASTSQCHCSCLCDTNLPVCADGGCWMWHRWQQQAHCSQVWMQCKGYYPQSGPGSPSQHPHANGRSCRQALFPGRHQKKHDESKNENVLEQHCLHHLKDVGIGQSQSSESGLKKVRS